MAASQYTNHPAHSALLIRKTFADLDLPDALMDRARQWWSGRPGVVYNSQQHRFTWPTGANITFGYLDTALDHERYQGSAFTMLGIDEASQIRPRQMEYLASRLRRSTEVSIPIRTIYCSNPGGIAHDWLYQRFIKSPAAGTEYIPAKLADNPGLDADEYRKQLALLDPVTRAQLENGDWNVRITTGWLHTDAIALRPAPPTGITQWCRAWDMAATEGGGDYTVGVLVGLDSHQNYHIADIRRGQWNPATAERQVLAAAASDPAGTMIRIEQEPGSSGLTVIRHYAGLLAAYPFRGVRATGDKTDRAKPLASAVANGLYSVSQNDWTDTLLKELAAFPEAVHDDQMDALALAHNTLAQSRRKGDWGVLV